MKRQKSEKHLDFIRGLPCLVCGDNTSTEAAHIRYADPRVAKRPTGMGEKSDDAWAVPLCGKHHREQHENGEFRFWISREVDPIFVALALFRASGNFEDGEHIVRQIWARH